ncbi:citrate/2-methylcitrate synthase [Selenomonas sp. TAMA-11512]|uniref:citrate synthase n=1 Tax=Selenomonas sp. TAMA-11512 TaxID=3095337 RepID=UPI00308661E7|nr:citrate/2-methylcitrate synthase [Selenomonas sp. TAMA-11512]
MDHDINLAQFYGKSLNFTNIPREWYPKYNVKRGLRNEDKTGVLIGLTRIADVVGYKLDEEGKKVDAEGELYYRGVNIMDMASQGDGGYLYEEASFLLLFGYLPRRETLEKYCQGLKDDYELPDGFIETHLLDHPSKNLMNQLQRLILALYNYDEDPDATDPYRTLLKGINIMAKLPSLACYALTAKNHYYGRDSLVLHYPSPSYSTAENILSMLRLDGKFTKEEAHLLDVMLFLHADHGGGTNSTFANVVVSSTDTDIYSALASSIGSLKGPRHGGANVRVAQMMKKVIDRIGIDAEEKEIESAIEELLRGGLDNPSKLVYGIGHAVYTISDPRAEIIRREVGALAREKGEGRKFDFYVRFEDTAKRYLSKKKGINMSSNVDFYSGFAYELLGIPQDFYTPLFVLARTVGWIAHNVEHKLYDNRIVRPASKYVGELNDYVPRSLR